MHPTSTIAPEEVSNFLESNIKGLSIASTRRKPQIKKDNTPSKPSEASESGSLSQRSTQPPEGNGLGPVEIFFGGTFNKWVYKLRYIIILIGFAAAGYSGVRASELQGLSSMEQFFRKDHQLTKSFYAVLNDFNEGD